jgi:hypothetical protein
MSDLSYPLIHQQKIHPWAPMACTTDQELLLNSGKPPVLLLADAPVLAISCAVAFMAKTISWSEPSLVEVHW